MNYSDFAGSSSFAALNKEMLGERSRQQRITKRSRRSLASLAEELGLSIQRTKANGQTMMVGIFRSGEGLPIARWWVISKQLVFDNGEKVYGVDNESAALDAVADFLQRNNDSAK